MSIKPITKPTHKSICELSDEYREKAREIETLISQQLSRVSQVKVCEETGAHKDKINRIVNNDLDLIASMLAVLDLKVVPKEYIYCDPEIVDATAVFLQHAASSPNFMRRLLSGQALPKGSL